MYKYVENTSYSTNKYSCVRRVHILYISYFIEHNGDDEPRDDFIPFFVQAVINPLFSPRTILRTI